MHYFQYFNYLLLSVSCYWARLSKRGLNTRSGFNMLFMSSPPQERPLVPAASIRERSTIPKSSLLDVDSLAEIDIKKVSVADLQMAASTDDVDDRSRTYSSKVSIRAKKANR